MRDEAQWVDVSHIGNPAYEEQMDVRAPDDGPDSYRHRLRSLSAGHREWTSGPAPEPKKDPTP